MVAMVGCLVTGDVPFQRAVKFSLLTTVLIVLSIPVTPALAAPPALAAAPLTAVALQEKGTDVSGSGHMHTHTHTYRYIGVPRTARALICILVLIKSNG